MLTINLPFEKYFDEKEGYFVDLKSATYRLEYSLLALSKWEAVWEKPYLPTGVREKDKRTLSENLSFVRCMVLGPIPDHDVERLYRMHGTDILDYVSSPSTATVFSEDPPSGGGGSYVTSELIYYWMITHGIPIETERWNLNRLLTLIKIFVKKAEDQKTSPAQNAEYRSNLNKQRLAANRKRPR
jgi:hypothetical protein